MKASILPPAYATMPINQIIFWFPSGLFEIVIGLWLLIRGIKKIPQEDAVSGSAETDKNERR